MYYTYMYVYDGPPKKKQNKIGVFTVLHWMFGSPSRCWEEKLFNTGPLWRI